MYFMASFKQLAYLRTDSFVPLHRAPYVVIFRPTLSDFQSALSTVCASVAPDEIKAYVKWNSQFGTTLKNTEDVIP